jgi:hypothetical protein
MHKRTIALAAAALLFNGGAVTQAALQKQPRPHRTAANSDRRTDDAARAESAKPA